MVAPLKELLRAQQTDDIGQPMVEASQGFDQAIGAVANRCRAAGSSALQ